MGNFQFEINIPDRRVASARHIHSLILPQKPKKLCENSCVSVHLLEEIGVYLFHVITAH